MRLARALFAIRAQRAQMMRSRRVPNAELADRVNEMSHRRHVLPATNLFDRVAVGESMPN
jgi:hypothetical protein